MTQRFGAASKRCVITAPLAETGPSIMAGKTSLYPANK